MQQQSARPGTLITLGLLASVLMVTTVVTSSESTPKQETWEAELFFRVKEALKNGQPGKRVILYTHDNMGHTLMYEHEAGQTCDVTATERCHWTVRINKIIGGRVTSEAAYLEVTMEHTDRLEDNPSITVRGPLENRRLSLSIVSAPTTPGSLFDRKIRISALEVPR